MVKKRPKTRKGTTQATVEEETRKYHDYFVYIPLINKTYLLKKVKRDILVKDFQGYIELVCGIPSFIQRLSYLDAADIRQDIPLDKLDTVSKATFTLRIFQRWERLLKCVYTDDVKALLKCDVLPYELDSNTKTTSHTRPIIELPKVELEKNATSIPAPLGQETLESRLKNSVVIDGPSHPYPSIVIQGAESLKPTKPTDTENEKLRKQLKKERKKRAEIALYIAAHFGRLEIIRKLLSLGTNINCRTKLGYTPLHASIVAGHYPCIDFLLENGARSERRKDIGKYTLSISQLYNHTETERHLLLFEWKSRSKEVSFANRKTSPLLSHQQSDSQCPTWFNGPYLTQYFCNTTPRNEFSGTRFGAPRTELSKVGADGKDVSRARKNITLSYETWLQNKIEQKTIEKQHERAEKYEREQQKQKDEEERQRNFKESLKKRENEKRSRLIRDEINEKKKSGKMNIYEDYEGLPSYSRVIFHQIYYDVPIGT